MTLHPPCARATCQTCFPAIVRLDVRSIGSGAWPGDLLLLATLSLLAFVAGL